MGSQFAIHFRLDIRIAPAESYCSPATAKARQRGHAIECRINAENPVNFTPSPGRITGMNLPGGVGVRVDTWVNTDCVVPPYYDSLLAKLIIHGETRQAAADLTLSALNNFHVSGIDTLIPFLKDVIADPQYRDGKVNTRWLEKKLESYTVPLG